MFHRYGFYLLRYPKWSSPSAAHRQSWTTIGEESLRCETEGYLHGAEVSGVYINHWVHKSPSNAGREKLSLMTEKSLSLDWIASHRCLAMLSSPIQTRRQLDLAGLGTQSFSYCFHLTGLPKTVYNVQTHGYSRHLAIGAHNYQAQGNLFAQTHVGWMNPRLETKKGSQPCH